MRKLIAIASLALIARSALAAPVEQDQPFTPYTVTDAFGATNTLSRDTRFVIISSEKGVSARVNEWLQAKDKDYLPHHRAEYVSDITPMPGIITTMFALPKMKKYPYKILLSRDPEFAKTYPAKDGKIALFILNEDQRVSQIIYVEKAKELDSYIKD